MLFILLFPALALTMLCIIFAPAILHAMLVIVIFPFMLIGELIEKRDISKSGKPSLVVKTILLILVTPLIFIANTLNALTDVEPEVIVKAEPVAKPIVKKPVSAPVKGTVVQPISNKGYWDI